MDYTVLLAGTPIIVLLIVLFVFRKPLIIGAPIAFITTLIIGVLYWRVSYDRIAGSTIKGSLVALDIALIIFGALLLLEFMKQTKLINSLEYYLAKISPDMRVQSIIIVWFFGAFIEGAAGFGTPAAVVAPLLVGLGFSPISAVVGALIANSTAVVFGAVGTPIKLGLSGLDVSGVSVMTAGINLSIGIIVPLMMITAIVLSNKGKWNDVLEIAPFALLSGILFVIPYFLLSFLGPEFPSLLGSIIGLGLLYGMIRLRVLMPHNVWRLKKKSALKANHSLFDTLLPYIILTSILVASKIIILQSNIHIAEGISHNIVLLGPAMAFFITLLLCRFVLGYTSFSFRRAFSLVFTKIGKAFLIILLTTAFVQIMINSGINNSGLDSMVHTLAVVLQTPMIGLIAPFIGAFGSFIAGSATVSNIMFGALQNTAAQSIGYNSTAVLSLQTVGAGAGNMIALNNIIAAQTTVGLQDKEAEIFKKTIVPCLIYLLFAGVIGVIIGLV
ncbi:MAG: L-lactate permease [Candidatus Woesearchaeota archaeon]